MKLTEEKLERYEANIGYRDLAQWAEDMSEAAAVLCRWTTGKSRDKVWALIEQWKNLCTW